MQLVGAGLGDGVDNAADRTAKLCRVDAGLNLELANGDLRGGVAGAGAAALFAEEALVVIGTVNFDVI